MAKLKLNKIIQLYHCSYGPSKIYLNIIQCSIVYTKYDLILNYVWLICT